MYQTNQYMAIQQLCSHSCSVQSMSGSHRSITRYNAVPTPTDMGHQCTVARLEVFMYRDPDRCPPITICYISPEVDHRMAFPY